MAGEYSNEDISRMIRMEQKTASSFNEKLNYADTRAYRELTLSQKEEFQKFISKKGRASHTLLILALLVYASSGVLYFNLTGNVIKESVTIVQYSFIKHISNFLVLFTTILIVLLFINDNVRQYIFQRNLKSKFLIK
jgi:hypothetical protein